MESSRQRFFHLMSDVAYTEVSSSGPCGGGGCPRGAVGLLGLLSQGFLLRDTWRTEVRRRGGWQGQVLLRPPGERQPRPLLAPGGCRLSLLSRPQDTPLRGCLCPRCLPEQGSPTPPASSHKDPYRWFGAVPNPRPPHLQILTLRTPQRPDVHIR